MAAGIRWRSRRVSAALDLIRAMAGSTSVLSRQPAGDAGAAGALFMMPTTSPRSAGRGGPACAADRREALQHRPQRQTRLFPEIFRRPATACGGTLRPSSCCARRHRLQPGRRHPSRPTRPASGFCYSTTRCSGILGCWTGIGADLLRRCRCAPRRRRAGRLCGRRPASSSLSIHEAGRLAL